MSTATPVERDERTVAVENAGYRWAYNFISYGLLVLVAVRSFYFHESSWDLLALVIVGGGVGVAYQAFYRVLNRQWVLASACAMLGAAVIAAALALLR